MLGSDNTQHDFGDLVRVRWLKTLSTPARVVVGGTPGFILSDRGLVPVPHVVVATHLPYMALPPGVRVLPIGTPAYASFPVTDVSTLKRDPNWDPFAERPAATPEEIRVISGDRRWRLPNYEGLTHVGAYIPSTWYPKGAPVWAWDGEWREANILEAGQGWIKVKFLDSHRTHRRSKAYRPHEISPAICEESRSDLSIDWSTSPLPHWESYRS